MHIRKSLKKIKNTKGVVSYEFNGKTEAAKLLASMNGWEAPKEVNVNGDITSGGKRLMDFGGIPKEEETEE